MHLSNARTNALTDERTFGLIGLLSQPKMEYKIFSKLQPYVKHLFETNIGELEYLLVEDFLLKFLHFANKTHHMCRLM